MRLMRKKIHFTDNSASRLDERRGMVDVIRQHYRFRDSQVLEAMSRVPRHRFVPESVSSQAYQDNPLAIGFGQTISQPYIVAYMTGQLNLTTEKKVLEIGTGCGYQTAILAELAQQVYTMDIVKPLIRTTARRLRELGYRNIHIRCGDGSAGWPDSQSFDAIIVTCAAETVPEPLIEQLAPNGRLIIPVGSRYGAQTLVLIQRRDSGKLTQIALLPVRFVPMLTGTITP